MDGNPQAATANHQIKKAVTLQGRKGHRSALRTYVTSAVKLCLEALERGIVTSESRKLADFAH